MIRTTGRAWILLAGLFFACGGQTPEEPQEPRLADAWSGDEGARPSADLEIPADAPRVVFLGDSLAAGLHLDEDLAFPAVAQRLLAERGAPFQLVNAGISGDTTSGGLARVDWILKPGPQVVVVELGCNDGLRGLDLEQIEANLRGILERVRASGAEALLLEMHIPTSYGRAYEEGFSSLYGELAEELGVASVPRFLEGVGGQVELNLPDGIHPNARGHELLAQKLVDPLETMLGD